MISFYNKTPDVSKLPEVNWEDWSQRINTRGLVDKIRKNTDSLMNEKYNVEAVANKLGGEYSDDYTRIVVISFTKVGRAALSLHSLVYLLQGERRANGPGRRNRKPKLIHASRLT